MRRAFVLPFGLILPERAQHQFEQQPWWVIQQPTGFQQQVTVCAKAQAGVGRSLVIQDLDDADQGSPLTGLTAQPQFARLTQQGEGPAEGRRLFVIGPAEEVILLGESPGLLTELVKQLGNPLILLIQPLRLLLDPFRRS